MLKIKVGTYVQILDGSDWHELYGIVDKIIDGIPLVATVTKPLERYWVHSHLRNKVQIIDWSL